MIFYNVHLNSIFLINFLNFIGYFLSRDFLTYKNITTLYYSQLSKADILETNCKCPPMRGVRLVESSCYVIPDICDIPGAQLLLKAKSNVYSPFTWY